MLTGAFAGELFGVGQPLEASRYFIILPDAVGAGKSSKPSDGLRNFAIHYDDMVAAQYRLVTEGLGIRHLRLVLATPWAACHLDLGAPPRFHGYAGRWRRSPRRWPAATG
jgi:homoserine O-acetyltransferase